MIADLHRSTMLAAQAVIRSATRDHAYWARGDRLLEIWLGELQLDSTRAQAAAVTLPAALDTLYERSDRPAELHQLTLDLEALTRLGEAQAWLRTRESTGSTLIDATRTLIAAIAVEGVSAVGGCATHNLADDWLFLWRQCLQRHNGQQEAANVLDLSEVIPEARSFGEGVAKYVAENAEAGAGPLALIGALPFSSALSAVELEDVLRTLTAPGLLHLIARLLRLAQDMNFDLSEPLNAGIVGLAAEHRTSVLEAAELGPALQGEVESRLGEYWLEQRAELTGEIEQLLHTDQRAAPPPVLTGVIRGLFRIVDLMASK